MEALLRANSTEERAKREEKARKKIEGQGLVALVKNGAYRKKIGSGFGLLVEERKSGRAFLAVE